MHSCKSCGLGFVYNLHIKVYLQTHNVENPYANIANGDFQIVTFKKITP